MKKTLFATLLALLLAAGCSAVSIDVQDSVPAGTVWSFSVTLPNPADFDDAQVLLDGDSLIKMYAPSGKILIDEGDVDKTKVFSYTEPVGNTVYFLVSPQSEGIHEIDLRVDGETRAEEEPDFFEIYDAGGTANLQNQINSIRANVTSLVEEFNGMDERLETALTEEDRQALQASIDSLQASLTGLETGLEEQELDSAAKANALLRDIEALRAELNKLKEPKGFGVGLASLPADPQAQAGALAIIIAFGVAVLVVKFRDKLPLKKGIYGKPKSNEGTSFSKRDEDITEQVLEETQETRQKGKWAFGSAKPVEKEERKRFNVGDLIKK